MKNVKYSPGIRFRLSWIRDITFITAWGDYENGGGITKTRVTIMTKLKVTGNSSRRLKLTGN